MKGKVWPAVEFVGVSTALKLVSVEDYLAGELQSAVKHEYLGGVLYAMAGARYTHNLIASNVLIALGARLRGHKCRALNSDSKIRIRLPHQTRFYYPDASVVCNPGEESYQDEPRILVEVLSQATRRLDEGEKKDAYLTIPSLELYLLLEQQTPAAVAFRRTDEGFVREVYQGLEQSIEFGLVQVPLVIAELYDGVTFRQSEEE
ncbi:Uma2 family endonuclease [bacterium CPR1]|nr:Uma2 family endonuclease [bacterium CPR1]